MIDAITLADYEQAETDLRAWEGYMGFVVHALLYVLVNTVLVVIQPGLDAGVPVVLPAAHRVGHRVDYTLPLCCSLRGAQDTGLASPSGASGGQNARQACGLEPIGQESGYVENPCELSPLMRPVRHGAYGRFCVQCSSVPTRHIPIVGAFGPEIRKYL